MTSQSCRWPLCPGLRFNKVLLLLSEPIQRLRPILSRGALDSKEPEYLSLLSGNTVLHTVHSFFYKHSKFLLRLGYAYIIHYFGLIIEPAYTTLKDLISSGLNSAVFAQLAEIKSGENMLAFSITKIL